MKKCIFVLCFLASGCALNSDLERANYQLSSTKGNLYDIKNQLEKAKKELSIKDGYIAKLEAERNRYAIDVDVCLNKLNRVGALLDKPKKSCNGGICFKYD